MNRIFVIIVLAAYVMAAATGRMDELTAAIVGDGKKAVELAIGLVGVMALFLGLMKVAEAGGMLRVLARLAAPVMRRLFPDVPTDHPAMSAMLMNISANMMGLTNAATPFGIRAMEQLDTLNGKKGTATNSMVLFLAINTAGLAILPSGVIGVRAAAGSQDAAGIFFPTWFASGAATLVGILAAFLLSRLPSVRASRPPEGVEAGRRAASDATSDDGPQLPTLDDQPPLQPPPRWLARGVVWGLAVVAVSLGALHVLGALRGATPDALLRHWTTGAALVTDAAGGQSGFDVWRGMMSGWTLPLVVAGIVLFGWARGVRVYEVLVDGAKDGFNVALRIIPYLVAILVAVGMLRAAGGVDLLVWLLDPLTSRIGMPAEALPQALLRPLSGSGAFAVMASTLETHGPDSFLGYMVSTFQGSTDTTFYVLAVYFGAVRVKDTRHALPACLLADLTGILAAVFIVHAFFG